eukprot:TRINITY_DN3174_c1_g2_i1.p1 TRINITY_DN3174_c1_g2~~TRINITY_DN3174_c1_g2_i1.p1  ORF type:complete len:1174 (-),score=368.20 TRINITY_DN3174_c1_g2_i1:155-3676(-)
MSNTSKHLQVILSNCRFPKAYNFFLGIQLVGAKENNKFRTEVSKESSDRPIFTKNCFTFEFDSNIEEPTLLVEAFVVLRGNSDSNSGKATGTARPFGSTSLNLKNSLNDLLQIKDGISRTINLFRVTGSTTKVVGELSMRVQIINSPLPTSLSSRRPKSSRQSFSGSNNRRTVKVFVFGASDVHGESNPPVSFVTLKSTYEMKHRQRGSATTRLVEGSDPSFNMNLFVPIEELGDSQANDLFIGLVSPNTKKLLAKTTIPISGLIHGHQLNLAIPLDSVVGQYSTKLFCSLTLVETAQSEIQVFEQDSTLNRLEIHLYSLNNLPSISGTVVACLHLGDINAVPKPTLPFDDIDPTLENLLSLNEEHEMSFGDYHQIGQTVRLSNSKFRQRFVFVTPSSVVDNNSILWIGWYYRREDTSGNSENMGYFLAGVSRVSLQTFRNVQLPEKSTGIEIPLPKLAVEPVGVWAKSSQFNEVSVAAKIRLRAGSSWLKYLQSNKNSILSPEINLGASTGSISARQPLSSDNSNTYLTANTNISTNTIGMSVSSRSIGLPPQNHALSQLSITSPSPIEKSSFDDSNDTNINVNYLEVDETNNGMFILDSSRTLDIPNTDINTYEIKHTLEASINDLGPIVKGETISINLGDVSIEKLFNSLQSDQEERELPYQERIHDLLLELDSLTKQLKHSEESYIREKEKRMKFEADLEKYSEIEMESKLLVSIPRLEELQLSQMSKENLLNVYEKIYSSYEMLFSEFTRLKTLQMNFNNISITKNIIEKKYLELQQEFTNLQNKRKMENLRLSDQVEKARRAMRSQEDIIEQYELRIKDSEQSQLALQARAKQQIQLLTEKITFLNKELQHETDKRKQLASRYGDYRSNRIFSANERIIENSKPPNLNPSHPEPSPSNEEFQKKYRGHIESLEHQIEMLSVQRIKDEQVINTLREELEKSKHTDPMDVANVLGGNMLLDNSEKVPVKEKIREREEEKIEEFVDDFEDDEDIDNDEKNGDKQENLPNIPPPPPLISEETMSPPDISRGNALNDSQNKEPEKLHVEDMYKNAIDIKNERNKTHNNRSMETQLFDDVTNAFTREMSVASDMFDAISVDRENESRQADFEDIKSVSDENSHKSKLNNDNGKKSKENLIPSRSSSRLNVETTLNVSSFNADSLLKEFNVSLG